MEELTPIYFSIIIPAASNDAETLATVEQLTNQPGKFEIILAHRAPLPKGFGDAVRQLQLAPQRQDEEVPAAHAGELIAVQTLSTPDVSRGAMLNAAAGVAEGEVLFFLWPGVRLPAEALLKVENNFKLLPQTIGGNFHLEFDPPSFVTTWLTGQLKKWRYAGRYFGYSGIFVRKYVFDALGGCKDIDLLEDLDFSQRLEEYGATLLLPDSVVFSAARFRRRPLATTISWLLIYSLYRVGVPPNTLASFYPK